MSINQSAQENGIFLVQFSKSMEAALVKTFLKPCHVPEQCCEPPTAKDPGWPKSVFLLAPVASSPSSPEACYRNTAGQIFLRAISAGTGAIPWISGQRHRWDTKGDVVQQR